MIQINVFWGHLTDVLTKTKTLNRYTCSMIVHICNLYYCLRDLFGFSALLVGPLPALKTSDSASLLMVFGVIVGRFQLVWPQHGITSCFVVAVWCMRPAFGAQRSNSLLSILLACAAWLKSLAGMVSM